MFIVVFGVEFSFVYVGKFVIWQFDFIGSVCSQEVIVGFFNVFEIDSNFGVDFKGMQYDVINGIYIFIVSIGVVGDQLSVVLGVDLIVQGVFVIGMVLVVLVVFVLMVIIFVVVLVQGGVQ